MISLPVTPTIQFSNHLLNRFKQIYELKDLIPVTFLQPLRFIKGGKARKKSIIKKSDFLKFIENER